MTHTRTRSAGRPAPNVRTLVTLDNLRHSGASLRVKIAYGCHVPARNSTSFMMLEPMSSLNAFKRCGLSLQS
eukprot:21661-Eustigmatos_ZCMA.PRE.1